MAKTRIINVVLTINRGRTELFKLDRCVAMNATPAKIHSLAEKFTTNGRDLFTALGTYRDRDQLTLTVEVIDHVRCEVLTHITTVF